jgi:hypothetical protein
MRSGSRGRRRDIGEGRKKERKKGGREVEAVNHHLNIIF